MDPVKASPEHALDPALFSVRFAAVAREAGLIAERFGEIEQHPLEAFTKRATAADRPHCYLSAGIHGDEPAPPWTLYQLAEEGFFDDRFHWTICPLLNPTGFARKTRENFAGMDLNRDYRQPRTAEIQAHVGWLRRQPVFDLAICLHEDWEAKGFYLYELNPLNRPTLGLAMLEAVRKHGAIESATRIDGRDIAEPGIIRPVSDPALRDLWPEAIYLREYHGTLQYTLESPSALPLEERVTQLKAAVTGALAAYRG